MVKDAKRWYKLVNYDEYEVFKDYLEGRIAHFKYEREKNAEPSLNNAVRLQAVQAVERELKSMKQYIDEMSKRYLDGKE